MDSENDDLRAGYGLSGAGEKNEEIRGPEGSASFVMQANDSDEPEDAAAASGEESSYIYGSDGSDGDGQTNNSGYGSGAAYGYGHDSGGGGYSDSRSSYASGQESKQSYSYSSGSGTSDGAGASYGSSAGYSYNSGSYGSGCGTSGSSGYGSGSAGYGGGSASSTGAGYGTGSTDYGPGGYASGSTAYGESSGTSAGGAGSGSSGGSGGYSDRSYIPPEPPKKKPKAKTVVTMTRRGFILLIIVCMLVTSGLTFGGFVLYSNSRSADGTATNYTLTTSNESLSYNSIVKKTENSVVSITTESISTDSWIQNYITQGAGSGVIIQSDGYIMTCNHVISGAMKITVTLKDKKTYSAKLIGTDAENDIAILKIDAKNLSAATYGDSSKLEVGDQVIAIGNPLGQLGGTATLGIISALDRSLTIDGRTLNLLQTDASINPGNSGGALFDAAGNLIGIVVAKSTGSDVEGLGFAIPINTAAEIGKTIIKSGKSISTDEEQEETDDNTPKIGVSVRDFTEEEAMQEGLSDGAGVYILSVTGGNAQRAGFQAGDKIIAVDREAVSSFEDLEKILKSHKKGDTVAVTVSRFGQRETLNCKLS